MPTFSDLVDAVCSTTDYVGQEELAASFVNGAFRELQSTGLYEQDLVEDRIETAGASTQPFLWRDVPKGLRAVSYVKYSNGVSPVPIKLGRRLQELKGNYYYLAGSYIAFSGAPQGEPIDIAYYMLQPRLTYYANQQEAPAYEDADGVWHYRKWNVDTQAYEHVDTLGSYQDDYLTRMKVTNWIIEDYFEAAKAIAVREVYNAYGDTADSSVWTAIAAKHTQTFKNLCGVKGIYT